MLRPKHFILFAIALSLSLGCKKPQKEQENKPDTSKNATPAKENLPAWAGAVDKAMKSPNPKVVLTTSMGEIELELDTKKAPISSRNFLSYVAKGHYKNTIFHRVIPSFMIQGGGFTTDRVKKGDLLPSIKNEAKNGLSNKRGTLAMARTGYIHSARAQFFINVVDNSRLDHKNNRMYGYAVFGRVTKGMDVVDKIRNTPTSNQGGPFAAMPNTMVVITGARIK